MGKNRKQFYRILLLFYDILSIIGAFFIARGIRISFFGRYGAISSLDQLIFILVEGIFIWPTLFYVIGVYDISIRKRKIDNFFSFCKLMLGVIGGITVITAVLYFIKNHSISRLFIGLYGCTLLVILALYRIIFMAHLERKSRYKESCRKVLLVGVSDKGKEFIEYVNNSPHLMIDIIGYLNIHDEHRYEDLNHLGNMGNLIDVVQSYVVDEVVFALSQSYMSTVEAYLCDCEKMGVTVHMILDFYNELNVKTNIDMVGTLPVITFHTVSLNEFQLHMKRMLDVLGAAVGLFITALISLFVVPAILIESPGNVIFTQKRVGKNGRVFKIYKFRSMYMDAEKRKKELLKYNQMTGNMFKLDNDPRITKIGKLIRKTSIDELPQFWNVLRGDMSLVGTRPPTLDEVKHYDKHHFRRISIKPGLTGMWQVSGRSDITDFEEVVRLDTEYIDKWSLWMDIKIILKTIIVVLMKKGSR